MNEITNETLHAILLEVKDDVKSSKEWLKGLNGRTRKMEIWRGFITGGLAIVSMVVMFTLYKLF